MDANGDEQAIDRRKIRAGLAIVSVVTVIAVVVAVVTDSVVTRAIMLAVIVLAFVRLTLLVRAVRRGRAD